MVGLFIFRRDFRISDNHALIDTINNCDRVFPIFIFDPYQIEKNTKNKNYRSDRSIRFMLDSLEDLNKQLNNSLHCFLGDPLNIIQKLKKKINFDVIGFNKDFSKYSCERDQKIEGWGENNSIRMITYDHDNVLVDYNKVLSGSGKPYTVFSSYYKKALKLKTNQVRKIKNTNFIKKSISGEIKIEKMRQYLKLSNDDQIVGGRKEALNILKKITNWGDYNKKRDILSYDTTHLSGYLKFGCVSIREVYQIFRQKLSKKSDLIKQLYWRSHYFVLARYNDANYSHIEDRFKKLRWSTKYSKKMWSGETGFPVIDAAIREILATGFMHNRSRLLVANFSIKILHIDPFNHWWGGQEFFSRNLIDCCYANNFGNWLWILGPYDPSGYRFGAKNTFSGRMFRDVIKFAKWDPNLIYVRRWIPELKDVPDRDVKNWYTAYKKYPNIYTQPIVDFKKQEKIYHNMTKNK